LGYTLSDWDFLVLFRLFANKLRDSGNTHIAVQLEPSDAPGEQAEKAAKAVKYLDSYFGSAQVKFIGHLSGVLRGSASALGSFQPRMSDSPFVGPRPFEKRDSDRFFGRTRETEELLSLIIAHRAVLFMRNRERAKARYCGQASSRVWRISSTRFCDPHASMVAAK
jgi:hypothetical protein